MKQFSKADMKYLKQFEDRFNTAIKSDYVRNLTQGDLEKIAQIYYNTFNVRLSYVPNCGSCALSIMKTVGRKYNEQISNGNGESRKEEVK